MRRGLGPRCLSLPAGPVLSAPAIALTPRRRGLRNRSRPEIGHLPDGLIANDSIETALQRFRDRITDGRSTLSDFTAVQRVRGDLSDAVQSALRSGHGNRARLLRGVLREVDRALENASEGYLAANQRFAQASRDIEAVQAGRGAAMRGWTEDTIPAFRALTPRGQQAFRAGYADPLIGQAQTAAYGVNKVRLLTSDAFRDEVAAWRRAMLSCNSGLDVK
jgi:hypothetical protein